MQLYCFFVFAKYCKRACNYEDMSSCISSKEELVAKQLVSGAMVTMNHGTTQFVWKKMVKILNLR